MWTSCQNTSHFSILFKICCTWWRSMFKKQQFSFLHFFHSCVINHENEHTVLNKNSQIVRQAFGSCLSQKYWQRQKETKLKAKTKVMSEVQLVPLSLASNLKALILNNLMYLLLFTKCLCHGRAWWPLSKFFVLTVWIWTHKEHGYSTRTSYSHIICETEMKTNHLL